MITTFLLLALIIPSCNTHLKEASIAGENGTNNCLKLESLILNHDIQKIHIARPLGVTADTTQYDLAIIDGIYGERLFTLANEKFQCRDIDSIISIDDKTLRINLLVPGYDQSGPFTQDFVSNYWEKGNGYLLNKKLPSFKGKSFGEGIIDLDSLIKLSNKTLLHFGWLSCQGCMIEQGEIVKIKEERLEIQFVNITIDQAPRLNKYLVDRGNHFSLKAPYNRHSKSMIKPILFDERKNIFDYFHLDGLFPVNFLVDRSGTVEKIGALFEIFPANQDSIEVLKI